MKRLLTNLHGFNILKNYIYAYLINELFLGMKDQPAFAKISADKAPGNQYAATGVRRMKERWRESEMARKRGDGRFTLRQ